MEYLLENTSKDSFVFLTDNGSLTPIANHSAYPTLKIPVNEGVNLLWYKMKEFLAQNEVDVLVCCHADFFILEKDWDKKVQEAFEADDQLILAGFVGSRGVGSNGGRSHGVFLNFMGNTYRNGKGSPHSVHGQRINTLIPAACFDHCAMIYKVAEFDTLKSFWPDPAPFHFEDRILPAAANYNGYHCALIGVNCDHISGAKGTEAGMKNYFEMAKRWLDAHGLKHPEDGNYDRTIYLLAEHQFLDVWEARLHFLPFNVLHDYTVQTKGIRP
jgi:hypothetical protein